jgi:hypothetical protein
MHREKAHVRCAWWGALGCFTIAAATGAWYRFGLLQGFPWGLQLADVRHAHSHLMYFGWATPALMALIVHQLPRMTGRSVSIRFRWVIGLTLILALLAYPPFLLYGYRLAELGERQLPLAVMVASLNILAWYAYGGLYLRATWRIPRNLPLHLWDAALVFQTVASLGAWGRAILAALKVADPLWEVAMVHLFLDLFSNGWFLLALLGIAYSIVPKESHPVSRRYTRLLLLGLLPTFFLAMDPNLVPRGARLIASAGGVLVALGIMGHLRALWQRLDGTWRIPLIFLGIKGVVELGASLPRVALWAQRAGLRVSYLHWFLLGFVTLGLLAAAQAAWGPAVVRGKKWMTPAILLVLTTLIPLTQLWPTVWSGRWALHLAAWAAVAPAVVSLGMLMAALVRVWSQRTAAPDIEPGHMGA